MFTHIMGINYNAKRNVLIAIGSKTHRNEETHLGLLFWQIKCIFNNGYPDRIARLSNQL